MRGMTFSWMQGGGQLTALRLDAAGAGKSDAPVLTPAQLAEYPGRYPLMPGFVLKVASADDALAAQGTGQAAIAVEAVGKDQFSAPSIGGLFQFERDDADKVVALILRRHGQILARNKQ